MADSAPETSYARRPAYPETHPQRHNLRMGI